MWNTSNLPLRQVSQRNRRACGYPTPLIFVFAAPLATLAGLAGYGVDASGSVGGSPPG